MTSARHVIWQHSTNVVDNPNYTSYTNKTWAGDFKSIINFISRTTVQDGTYTSSFDPALLPMYEDDQRRLNEPATFPNVRSWRLETEADMENWWHTEVSNPVLSAWARYPRIQQTCHTKPLSDVNIPENVDATYGMYINGLRVPVVVGEMKRNLINPKEWLRRDLTSPQAKLAQELRGYAAKYQCPQIFCWDGRHLLLLQFRAQQLSDLCELNCPVDCWVIPREGSDSTCTLRYAFYRFLVQGLRRCQAMSAPNLPLTVRGLTPSSREFYTGQPIWTWGGVSGTNHPGGYRRIVDANSGALGWSNEQGDDVTRETEALW